MRQVLIRDERENVVFTDELSNSKGYMLRGQKGDFILARDTEGFHIWVRMNPAKATAKPVKRYESVEEAIEDKINNGYEVFEYTEVICVK